MHPTLLRAGAHLLGLKSQWCFREFCDVSEGLRTGPEMSLGRLTPVPTGGVSWTELADLSLGSGLL